MKAFRPFFLIMAFVALVGMACLGSSGTPVPPTQGSTGQSAAPQSSAPQSTAPQSSAPVSAASSSAAQSAASSGGAEFFTDSFDTDSISNYEIKNRHPGSDESKMDVSIKSGNMVFNLTGPNLWVYATYKPNTYTDVKLTVTADNRGKNNNSISLVCRQSSDGWYEFNIANNGLLSILAYDSTGAVAKGYNRIYNGGSLAVKQGKGINIYTATCKGNQLTLEINGVTAKTITDNKFDFTEGTVGFSVSSFDVTPILVNVNSFEVSKP